MNAAPMAPMAPIPPQARWRAGAAIAVRALTAILGGYALTAAAMALLAVLLAGQLAMQRADAAILATLLSFAIYACAVLWAFAARSAQRAFGAMLTLGGLLIGLLSLQGHGP